MKEIRILLNNKLKIFYYFLNIKIKDSYTLFIKFIISFILSANFYYNY
jgi:hypothetical protein